MKRARERERVSTHKIFFPHFPVSHPITLPHSHHPYLLPSMSPFLFLSVSIYCSLSRAHANTHAKSATQEMIVLIFHELDSIYFFGQAGGVKERNAKNHRYRLSRSQYST